LREKVKEARIRGFYYYPRASGDDVGEFDGIDERNNRIVRWKRVSMISSIPSLMRPVAVKEIFYQSEPVEVFHVAFAKDVKATLLEDSLVVRLSEI
jgi:hypothetical protein